jgi:hypothetical protein
MKKTTRFLKGVTSQLYQDQRVRQSYVEIPRSVQKQDAHHPNPQQTSNQSYQFFVREQLPQKTFHIAIFDNDKKKDKDKSSPHRKKSEGVKSK